MSTASDYLAGQGRSYGLVEGELFAWERSFVGIQAHPQSPNAYCLSQPMGRDTPRSIAAMELLIDDWTNPQDPAPMGISVAIGGEDLWIDGSCDSELACRFMALLTGIGGKVSLLVVWNGMGVVFHTFLRHLARPMAEMGARIQPLVTGTDIRAINVSVAGKQLTLCDIGVALGASRLDHEAILQSLGVCYLTGQTTARRLLRAADAAQDLMMRLVGVALHPTIAASSLKAAKHYLPADRRWFRPNLGLEATCRAGGAYRGGYSYSESYQGEAWRIDVNKMYTTLLRSPLPAGSTLSHAGEYGREQLGIFLCRVEGEGHFPSYIAPFSLRDARFHKETTSRPAAWAWLPTPEITALRGVGYHILAGLGFKFTRWVSLKGYADHLLAIQSRAERGSIESIVAKSLGNSLTGKLGQSPERLEVCYALSAPSGGWVPYVTADREVIPHLYWQQHLTWSGAQHVDAAAWLTAMGRAKVYGQLARIHSLGWRAVHVDTDGIILDCNPQGVLCLSAQTPGGWRYDGYDPDCVVAKSKWYSFKGEIHTAGLSSVTREQLEAVHYGRRVVIGRKVLANPLRDGPLYRETAIRMGV